MAHEMNIADRERWMSRRPFPSRSQDTEENFSASAVQRWNVARQGTITETVRGSHVDITGRLVTAGRLLQYTAIACLACGLAFMTYSVVHAFLSGRVHEILMHAAGAGQ